jgi:hypothetical protein
MKQKSPEQVGDAARKKEFAKKAFAYAVEHEAGPWTLTLGILTAYAAITRDHGFLSVVLPSLVVLAIGDSTGSYKAAKHYERKLDEQARAGGGEKPEEPRIY